MEPIDESIDGAPLTTLCRTVRCEQELEKIYEGDMGDIFDIAEARGALVRRRESLVAECKACHEVLKKKTG